MYKLLTAWNENMLAEQVNEYLRTGWKLYGNSGTGYDHARHHVYFFQAMIKEEPSNAPA